ncbi:MAG: DinB family protein [Flavobacteriales bacterium]
MEIIPQRSLELFSHVLDAHHIWNHRILKKSPEYGVRQLHPLKDWADIHYENQRSSFEIITNTDDFELRLDYENSEGRLFTNNIKDMLFHIINHSTHHRAQISVDFRTNGIDSLNMDYIFYKR